MIAPQAVAISTRSSLASLPAMLTAARAMGVREQVVDVTLPIAVALFRATGPAMNVAVAFYVAHWLGFQPTLGQMIAATAVGAVMSYGAVSLPGEVSFISSIAPIAMALGVPIAPLGLAGRGRDDPRHLPHRRQRHARRGADHGRSTVGTARRAAKPERQLTAVRRSGRATSGLCRRAESGLAPVEERATWAADRSIRRSATRGNPLTLPSRAPASRQKGERHGEAT